MSWVGTVLKLLRNEFFPNWIAGLISLFQAIVAVVSAIGLFLGLIEVEARFAQAGNPLFLSYLWTTFASSVVFVALSAILLQRLLRSHQDAAREADDRAKDRALTDRAMVVQHRMAEAVQHSAAQRGNYDIGHRLERVLGSELREYLKARLGNNKFYCTVKRILPLEDGGYCLADVFRDAEQDTTTRPRRQKENADSNYLYHRFKCAGIADSKQIYIPDVERAQVFDQLATRAHTRGYRSVLAFPLNQPALPSTATPDLNRLVGFLGLDSPEPYVFDSFFEILRNSGASDDSGRSEIVYKPLDELNLFYGIADSVATILMLSQNGKDQRGANEAKSGDS